MQRRNICLSWLVAVLALSMLVHAQTVKVNLHIILVDQELNQKPVPWFHVTLRREDTQNSELFDLITKLDGTCDRVVPTGRYELVTPHAIDLQGRRYTWSMDVAFSRAQEMIELTNDNATVERVPTAVNAPMNNVSGGGSDLSLLFERLKKSTVTVRADSREGSGFIVDASGLVVTNNHVVEFSRYLAVLFDQKHKVTARVLAADPGKDIAVLWVNLQAFPEAVIAPLLPSGPASRVVVGERVFTIGNPLGEEKVFTSGFISKVEHTAIFSDININPGSSGGPLFNLRGEVTGITSAQMHLLASIVPIDDARPVIERARHELSGASPPSAELLPVEPDDFFPSEALLSLLRHHQRMDVKPYSLTAGEFRVKIMTPPLRYYVYNKAQIQATHKGPKHSREDSQQDELPEQALEEAQEYPPTVIIQIVPKHGFWNRQFKDSFRSMRLLCAGKEVPPIDPGRSHFELPDNHIKGTTTAGFYSYQPDAISPNCGIVKLEIFSENAPRIPIIRSVSAATVERIWADMEPYRGTKGKE
jgi:S1-C subfamily serine protease